MTRRLDLVGALPRMKAPVPPMRHGRYASRSIAFAVAKRRRGGATLWVILAIPVALVALCLVLEIGHLRLARIELEDAMESAALSAAQEWGENHAAQSVGWTDVPRQYGVAYAAANEVRGTSVALDANYSAAAVPNENASYSDATGELVFGSVDDTDPGNVVFDATVAPDGGSGLYGVHAKTEFDVPSICGGAIGLGAAFRVRAQSTAVYDASTGELRLIRIDTFAPASVPLAP